MTSKEAELQAIRQYLSQPEPTLYACACLGPQGKEPVCPCAMQYVEVVDGVYYLIETVRDFNGISHIASFMSIVKS